MVEKRRGDTAGQGLIDVHARLGAGHRHIPRKPAFAAVSSDHRRGPAADGIVNITRCPGPRPAPIDKQAPRRRPAGIVRDVGQRDARVALGEREVQACQE